MGLLVTSGAAKCRGLRVLTQVSRRTWGSSPSSLHAKNTPVEQRSNRAHTVGLSSGDGGRAGELLRLVPAPRSLDSMSSHHRHLRGPSLEEGVLVPFLWVRCLYLCGQGSGVRGGQWGVRLLYSTSRLFAKWSQWTSTLPLASPLADLTGPLSPGCAHTGVTWSAGRGLVWPGPL